MAVKDIAGFTGPGRAHVLRSGRAMAMAMGADTRAEAAVEKVREARMAADLNMVDAVRVCGERRGGGGLLILGGVWRGREAEGCSGGLFFAMEDDLTQCKSLRDRFLFFRVQR